jgi:hypothetical protein
VIKFGPIEFGAVVTAKRRANDNTRFLTETRPAGRRVVSRTRDAHAKFDSTPGGSHSASPLPPPLQSFAVAHGCLLIPAVVAVWWFWTKRATQTACRKSQRVLATVLHRPPPSPTSGRNQSGRTYLRSLACGAEGHDGSPNVNDNNNDDDGAPINDNDDVYESWEQVVAKNEEAFSRHRSLRLVRWIRGPSELQHAHEHYQERRRRRSLESSLLRRRMMMPAVVADPCRVNTSPPSHERYLNTDEDDDDVFSRNWDYIQDLTDIELCSMGSVQISACDDDATSDSVEVTSRSNRYRPFV